ncbi:MAG: hypothetical protein COC19_05455 [SAR86 cluster bacterium]|uniref:CENP-V/GFA domain-containing protein n=1 Tax=SAR86 cluster bacterium TaxID=2030880 RepID=A0A2A4MM07_9GAMM|nr:MAG: hypothetical protein COC19_05455 [SAR86 cluster bacterium]
MIKGSCLCGNVTYDIAGNLSDIIHCHCRTCRKAHGSAFSSVVAVKNEDFKLSSIKPLSSFESSPGKTRYFCSNCGTQIYAQRADRDHLILRMGSLDTDISVKEKHHIWVSHKASWYTINSKLPECQENE